MLCTLTEERRGSRCLFYWLALATHMQVFYAMRETYTHQKVHIKHIDWVMWAHRSTTESEMNVYPVWRREEEEEERDAVSDAAAAAMLALVLFHLHYQTYLPASCTQENKKL